MFGSSVVIALYLNNQPVWSAYVFLLFVLTDLEGYIARIFHSESEWGVILDPWADKLLVLPILWCFFFAGDINHKLPLIITIREIIMFAGRYFAKKRKIDVSARFPGKLAAVTGYVAVFFLLLRGEFYILGLLILIQAAFLSIVSLVVYLYIFFRRSA